MKAYLQSRPLKRGFPPSISAKMHPTDHMSTINTYKLLAFAFRQLEKEALTGFGIVLEAKHNFRCSVPSSSNVFSHEASSIALWTFRIATSQAKVANLLFKT